MTDPRNNIAQFLRLDDTDARTDEDIFLGQPMHTPYGRAFGGQVLAQAIMAAARTVQADRLIHSMHGYFLRPGDLNTSMTFAVDRIYDGRSFSTRRTQAYQAGNPMLSLIASFQSEDSGIEHHVPLDIARFPEPESLPTLEQRYGQIEDNPFADWVVQRPFDIRHTESPIFLSVEGEHVAHQAEWVRSISPLPDDPTFHRAALAYVSDYSILEPIYRRHGISWITTGLRTASLDHAMWFHRPFRLDEWLLFVTESPTAQGGRGLSTGKVYTRDGLHVASLAQEGMVRVPTVPSGT
ncbi:acyl-CoA thioesterase II [Lysinibacter sp. HNR]|uniref:acyl-CoA thioesterase n=1 Tax=Lysinibacter sp. HNR TaxID=3031408 RepID=UPI002434F5F5|nr:acyl-CoA thioesterase II [Lysinibacter sp. HNR]WGD36438.1 acyl-CoA thioesterase II [Lysinibacter sp. HNR]